MPTKNKPRNGIKKWIYSSLATILIALVVQVTYAIWPWPTVKGAEALKSVLEEDWQSLAVMMNSQFADILQSIMQFMHKIFFELTGIDYLVGRALSPAPIEELGGEPMRTLVLVLWQYFLEPMYYSLLIITVRTAALFSLLPMFLVAGIAGTINGLVGRYLRATSGGKESGYIYHRAKQVTWVALAGLWAVYLIPPIHLNLALILPPFLVATLVAFWVVSHWFKKRL